MLKGLTKRAREREPAGKTERGSTNDEMIEDCFYIEVFERGREYIVRYRGASAPRHGFPSAHWRRQTSCPLYISFITQSDLTGARFPCFSMHALLYSNVLPDTRAPSSYLLVVCARFANSVDDLDFQFLFFVVGSPNLGFPLHSIFFLLSCAKLYRE